MRRGWIVGWGLALAALLAACALPSPAALPTDGPVTEVGGSASAGADEGFSIVPRPPRPGASPTEIVVGFLDAMQATPIQLTSARQFLTTEAADAWQPQRQTLVYRNGWTLGGDGDSIDVAFPNAVVLDSRGAWQGQLAEDEDAMSYRLVQVDGEWRIASLPDAWIVPQAWFSTRFSLRNLYFFDPSSRVLVPEPVFVPNGAQMATALVRALVAGPGDALRDVVTSHIPAGSTAGLSVPVSDTGVAAIDLQVGPPGIDDSELTYINAQLDWTLRQDPLITAFSVRVTGGVSEEGGEPVEVGTETAFDPNGRGVSNAVFGLSEGAVAVVGASGAVPVAGPFGSAASGVRSFAVDTRARTAAGVTADGTGVVTASLSADAVATVVPEAGTDLLAPRWDHLDRLWLVDRDPAAGARVLIDEGGHVRELAAPGIAGADVRQFLVSRDGTRLVALVAEAERDVLVVARIASDADGHVSGLHDAVELSSYATATVTDIAWASTTSVVVLSRLGGGALVRSVSLDGSDLASGAVSQALAADAVGLVGSPIPGQDVFVVDSDGLLALGTNRRIAITGAAVTDIAYPG